MLPCIYICIAVSFYSGLYVYLYHRKKKKHLIDADKKVIIVKLVYYIKIY